MTGGDPSVLALITAGLTEVKEAVNQLSKDLHGTLARLPNEYVPRRELDRRLDELTIAIGAERAAREQAARDAAAEAATQRRWRVGLAVASGMSAVGVLSGVIVHFT